MNKTPSLTVVLGITMRLRRVILIEVVDHHGENLLFPYAIIMSQIRCAVTVRVQLISTFDYAKSQ